MTTKAELEQVIVGLRQQIADLAKEIEARALDAQRGQQDLRAVEEAYQEATMVLGDLLISNRILQRRLSSTEASASHTHEDGPSVTAVEAQELGLA